MKQPKVLAKHVALLRGVNVGGNNLLPMKNLADIFIEAGCADVRTYIQSGNVIFRAVDSVVEEIPGRVMQLITKRFGYRTPVILRTAAQMGDTILNNPFAKPGTPENLQLVLFLSDLPNAERVRSLDPDRSPPDAFFVRGREIYLQFPNRMARTKLTNAWFDSKLATTSTGRNWNTVLKLFELMRDL
jgi:uncharacterized protein (DUF1697 family)